MESFRRPETVAEVAQRILEGEKPGMAVKDFLHEFHFRPKFEILEKPPERLEGKVDQGRMLDAYLQAMTVCLAARIKRDPPPWTWPPIQLKEPWFANPSPIMRNYLLMSAPAPFKTRNLFIDEDALTVA